MGLYSKYILCGLLLGIGFVLPVLWPLGIFGAAYYLYVVTREQKNTTAYLGSLMAWTIKFLFVLSFYWTMYPIEWLPFDFGSFELALIFLYWFTVSLFLGTSGIVFVAALHIIKKIPAPRWLFWWMGIPLIWLFSELGGSFLLSLFTLGPGSHLNAYFSFGYVGNLLGEHATLTSLARLAGVYGLSVIAVIAAVGILEIWKMKLPNTKLGLLFLFIILVASSSYTFASKETEGDYYKVTMIETSFPVAELFNRDKVPERRKMEEASLEAAVNSGSDYIILPEDARYFNQNDIAFSASYFKFKYPDSKVIVVDSGRVDGVSGGILQGMVYDANTNDHYTAHKRYLVPQGEFMPYFYSALFSLIGQKNITNAVADTVSYEVGPQTSQKHFPNNAPGILFCFENASGIGIHSLVSERDNIPFIAHQLSHSWFHTPTTFWHQIDTALRIQAVWNNVYVVSAGNFAPSQLYTPYGTIVEADIIEEGKYWLIKEVRVPKR